MRFLSHLTVLCVLLDERRVTYGDGVSVTDLETGMADTVQHNTNAGTDANGVTSLGNDIGFDPGETRTYPGVHAQTTAAPSVPGESTPNAAESSNQAKFTQNTTESSDQSESTQTTPTDSPSGEEHPLYDISHKIFLGVIPIITLTGVINNGLMLAVMQRPNQRNLSVSVFMSALAVADSIVLILDFINNWINFVSGVHLKSSSHAFCQIYNFVFTTAYTYSAWLVVCVSMERFIVVWYPLRAKLICTVRRSIIVVCVVPVLCAVFHSYNFIIWEISEDGVCDLDADYSYFSGQIYPWLNAVVYSYLPVAILLCSNGALIYKLVKAGQMRKTMGAERLDTMRITVSVVVICVSYILLTVPLTLFYAILFSLSQFIQRQPAMELARTIILILGLSNHAINFFLYVITSAKIRHEIMAMLGRHAVSKGATKSGSQGTVSTLSTDYSTAVTSAMPSTAM